MRQALSGPNVATMNLVDGRAQPVGIATQSRPLAPSPRGGTELGDRRTCRGLHGCGVRGTGAGVQMASAPGWISAVLVVDEIASEQVGGAGRYQPHRRARMYQLQARCRELVEAMRLRHTGDETLLRVVGVSRSSSIGKWIDDESEHVGLMSASHAAVAFADA
jgi:hypothetical protein